MAMERAHAALSGTSHVAAIDLGGTKIMAAIVSPEGRIVNRTKVPTGKKGGVADVIDKMADAVRDAAKAAGISADQLGAVGIGAPGPVTAETGIVGVAVNIPGWRDVPLKDELERRLGIPVVVDNDVRVAVIAEHAAGAGRGACDMVGLWPGTGIGGGIIIDDQIVRGAGNAAGEIGHMTLKPGGAKCHCGGRGHLESLASRTAIVRWIAKQVRAGRKTALSKIVKKGAIGRAKSGELAEAFNQGDTLVLEAVDRATTYLAIGIVNIANALNPQRVVMGGGLVAALGQPLIDQVARKVHGQPMFAATNRLEITKSELGDDAGILGAALIARRAHESGARVSR
ncbi:MAG: ROK family protein [Chloroflexota bacterium]|nr:MAG: ROK family protein [Chloroflexota bacterium]